MKNLTLKISEATTFKKPTDAVSKSDAGVDNGSEASSSFQMMLNKQVQAKRATTKEAQPQTQQSHKNVTTGNSNNASEESSVAIKDQLAELDQVKTNVQKNNQLRLAMAAKDNLKNNELQTSLAIKDTRGLDEKGLLSSVDGSILKGKVDEELLAKSENGDLINSAIVNANSSLVLPPAVVEAKSSEFSNQNNKQDLTSNLNLTDKQRGLDASIKDNALNSVLAQNKQASQTESQATSVDDGKQSHLNWLDSMLPNTKSQSTEDSANSKLALSAIQETTSKESDIKIATMTTSIQSALQTNAASTIQVAGSENAINVYPGKAGWDQAISQKIVWMLGAQEQSATLTLNPPELGPLQVVIHVHNDQADTTFISDNAEVRQALQDGLDNLRDKMNESGISLGQANVNSGGQAQQQFQKDANQNNMTSRLSDSSQPTQVELARSAQRMVRETNGLVDTFA